MKSILSKYLVSGDDKKTIAQLREEAYDLRTFDGMPQYEDWDENDSIIGAYSEASEEKLSRIMEKEENLANIYIVSEVKDTVHIMKKSNYTDLQILVYVGSVAKNEKQVVLTLKECGYSYVDMVKLVHEAGAQWAAIYNFGVNAGFEKHDVFTCLKEAGFHSES